MPIYSLIYSQFTQPNYKDANSIGANTLSQKEVDKIEERAEKATKDQTPYGLNTSSLQPIITPYEKKSFYEENKGVIVNISIGLFL